MSINGFHVSNFMVVPSTWLPKKVWREELKVVKLNMSSMHQNVWLLSWNSFPKCQVELTVSASNKSDSLDLLFAKHTCDSDVDSTTRSSLCIFTPVLSTMTFKWRINAAGWGWWVPGVRNCWSYWSLEIPHHSPFSQTSELLTTYSESLIFKELQSVWRNTGKNCIWDKNTERQQSREDMLSYFQKSSITTH